MSTPLVDRFRFLARRGETTKTPVLAQAPDPKVTGSTATLRLYDPIDSWGEWFGVSAKEFVGALDELPAGVTELRLHLNSPGGEVFEAIALLNALRQHPARVVAVVDGLAASAASFVAVGADELIMQPNSELMIHPAWAAAVGNADDLRDAANRLERLSDNIASIYQRKAGGSLEDWRAAMADETWYTAEEAVTSGLADRIGSGDAEDVGQAKAKFDLSVFAHAGRAHAPAPAMPATPRTPAATASGPTPTTQEGSRPVAFTDEQLTTMRQRLGVAASADEATILAALDEALHEHAAPPSQVTAEAWRAEAQRLSTEVAEIKAERAREAKDRARQAKDDFFAEMSRTGRVKPADRAELERQYDEAPQVVRNIVSARAAGSEVPVDDLGYTGGTESADPTVDDVRETPAYKNWRA